MDRRDFVFGWEGELMKEEEGRSGHNLSMWDKEVLKMATHKDDGVFKSYRKRRWMR